MKYLVYGVISATTHTAEIEADSPEEASEQFHDTDKACPSICHYCTKEVELGDVFETHVIDEEGNLIYNEEKLLYREVLKLLESNKSKEDIIKELKSHDFSPCLKAGVS